MRSLPGNAHHAPTDTADDRVRGGSVQVTSAVHDNPFAGRGTCWTGVLAGEPVHHDYVLDPQDQRAEACTRIGVSRSRPRLILHL